MLNKWRQKKEEGIYAALSMQICEIIFVSINSYVIFDQNILIHEGYFFIFIMICGTIWWVCGTQCMVHGTLLGLSGILVGYFRHYDKYVGDYRVIY